MSPRSQFPSAREPDTHFFCTISRGGRQKRFAVRPGVVYALASLIPLIGAVYLGATGYLFFRDDMVAALMTRQTKMQYAYEDRLAALRVQMDRVTSRQLLDQDSFESRVQQLAARQSQLETRTAVVATLGERLNLPRDPNLPVLPAAAQPRAPMRSGDAKNMPSSRSNPATGGPIQPSVSVFAPTSSPLFAPPSDEKASGPLSDKPRPDGFELRTSNEPDLPKGGGASDVAKHVAGLANDALADAANVDLPMPTRLETLSVSLDRIERRQIAVLSALAAPASRKVEQLRLALSEVGFSPDKLNAPVKSGVGGPLIPLKVDPNGSLFERHLSVAQNAIIQLDRINRALPYLPLRRPLNVPIEISSTFGYRVDPFLGRAALHSGLDMRADSGTAVLSTAAGVVVTAAPSGGYGNLVEIDHGNGLATRYGHLSAILVSEGQRVEIGSLIGRVGSTGRSTGPHLHYEVRVNDEATDPSRFLRAAKFLTAQE